MSSLLLVSFLFLIAGVIAVPIASKLGLGSVLGYLIAGIILSPILNTIGVDVISIQHIAEFGVVMMLFLVGLELEPRMLWQMKSKLLGLGGLQVALTTMGVMGIAMLLGQPWSIALAIGLVLCLSSTAIVLQTLNEKGLMKSDGGQSSFSVLLFQDIAVIPMLALIPLLAIPELMDIVNGVGAAGAEATDAHSSTNDHANDGSDGHGTDLNLVAGLSGWQQALVTLGAIAAVIIGGSFLTRPVFRYIAVANLRELFTATALLMVIGIALLMTLVGLSPALGTFLAGVVLANSEYRHELESDIEPFKGLLLGLFFMTVGASINFTLLFDNLASILLLTFGLMALKALVLFILSFIFNIKGLNRWLFTLALAQAGEFGFVLLTLTVANGVIPAPIAEQLLLIVALSMLFTPALFILYDKVIAPKFITNQEGSDDIDEVGNVIIAGHGRFGGVINRMLLSSGHKTVVLDHSSVQLERLRMFGVKVFFGDATRPDLLHAAGIGSASLLVVALDDKHQALELVRHVSQHHPNVHIVARAIDRHHVYDLYAAGAHDIIRDTFDSATRAGRSALEALGMHAYDAEKYTQEYVSHDKKLMLAMAEVHDPEIPPHENPEYVERGKALIAREMEMLSRQQGPFNAREKRGWLPPGDELNETNE